MCRLFRNADEVEVLREFLQGFIQICPDAECIVPYPIRYATKAAVKTYLAKTIRVKLPGTAGRRGRRFSAVGVDVGPYFTETAYRLWWFSSRPPCRSGLGLLKFSAEAASRIVPTTPRVRDILHRLWEAAGRKTTGWIFPAKKAAVGHIVPNTIYQHLDAVINSGICEKQFVRYALRHTCLSRWGASGMDAWTLARLEGHSNIKQSMTYVHPTDESLHAAIDRMRVRGGDKIGENAGITVSDTETRLLETSTI